MLMAKLRELEEHHSGTSYSAAGHDFNVNESSVY